MVEGKCCEIFNPLEPALVPADDLIAKDLTLRSFVNGEIRQNSSTADLIFGVGYLVWCLRLPCLPCLLPLHYGFTIAVGAFDGS